MTTVFISHSSKDSTFAAGFLKPFLEKQGVTVWCSSADDIPAAVDWERQIRGALLKSDWYIVVLSPDAAKSDWVRAEAHWALENRKGRVIPAMIRSCEPVATHLKLGTVQYIDFRTDLAGASAKLYSLIRGYPCNPNEPEEEATTILPAFHNPDYMINVVFTLAIGSEYQIELAANIDKQCVIGRAKDVDLHINDSSVSRRHARLSVVLCNGDKHLQIEDLGSANGTYVNNKQIISLQSLKIGDTIGLGAARLLLKNCASSP